MNVLFAMLELVYPPVSSYEAEWLKQDLEVQELLRSSDFYLIGARAEAKFTDVDCDAGYGILTVGIDAGSGLHDDVNIDLGALTRSRCVEDFEDLTFDLGPKILKVYGGTGADVDADSAELLEWFTTEKLIHERGRFVPWLTGFSRFREFATYDLQYVGIATKTSTFDRLFEGSHHARQRILSTEWVRRQGSRVTDETYLFSFRVAPTILRTLGDGKPPSTASGAAWEEQRVRVVKDAEKAFAHLLDPEYNTETYANYPRSTDGLFGDGFQRYGFVLAENLTFQAPAGTFHGSRPSEFLTIDDHADMLIVEGDQVSVQRGVDR